MIGVLGFPCGRLVRPDRVRELVAVQPRHRQVGQHEPVAAAFVQTERLAAVLRHVDLEAGDVQLMAQHRSVDRVIVGEQEQASLALGLLTAGLRPTRGSRCDRRRRFDRRRVTDRQRDGEPDRRSLAEAAAHRHVPTHQDRESLADHEPETGAVRTPRGRGLRLGELLEQQPLLIAREADAGIGHRQLDRLRRLRLRHNPRGHFDPADVGELDCVGEEVAQDLPEPQRIGDVGRREGVVGAPGEQQPLRGRRVDERVRRCAHDRAQVDRRGRKLELVGLDLREVEDVTDDLQQRLRRAFGRCHHLPLVRRELRARQHLEHPGHADHRRPDLVAHRRQESRLRPARALGRLACVAQLGGAGAHARLELGRCRLDLVMCPLALGGDRAQDEGGDRDGRRERGQDDEVVSEVRAGERSVPGDGGDATRCRRSRALTIAAMSGAPLSPAHSSTGMTRKAIGASWVNTASATTAAAPTTADDLGHDTTSRSRRRTVRLTTSNRIGATRRIPAKSPVHHVSQVTQALAESSRNDRIVAVPSVAPSGVATAQAAIRTIAFRSRASDGRKLHARRMTVTTSGLTVDTRPLASDSSKGTPRSSSAARPPMTIAHAIRRPPK